ncbi:MAG TPA: hypothetical protein VKV77_14315 [Methylovirgula sp.]|nr:hypothetical protein [Methylovirgula sp.]
MRARIPLAAAMALASLPALAASAAHSAAGPDPDVIVPLGKLVSEALSVIEPLVLSLGGAMLAWLVARLGPEIAKALHAAQIDRALTQAIDAGFALAEGAAQGKVLDIPVANAVIRQAAQYLVDHAPDVVKELGEAVGPILIARLSAAGALPSNASAANLTLAPTIDRRDQP